MKFWLMVVLCLPGAKTCKVEWSQAVYPRAEHCERAARALFTWPELFPHVEGVFCEIAKRRPRNYRISRGQLP